MDDQEKDKTRLLLFPLPLQGHVTPMLNLATLLQSKGFSVTIIHTRYKAPDPTEFVELNFYFIDDGLLEDAVPAPGYYSLVPVLMKNCVEPFRDCLSCILNGENNEHVCCLIVDPLWMFVGSVADSFDLPWLTLFTGGVSSLLIYHSLPDLRGKGYFPLQDGKLNEEVVELPPLKVKDLPIELYHDMVAIIVKEMTTSRGIICNTFKELETASLATLQQALTVPIFSLGPLHLRPQYLLPPTSSISPQHQATISWLNKQAPKSVLYVSFGSLAHINEDEFQEIALALANSMLPFLWVVREGLIRSSQVKDLLPRDYIEMVGDKGLIVKWAPQKEVLGHPSVGGFWTHCGWNSIIESVSQGVPMICLPFFIDQPMNARHVSDNWRVGFQLERAATKEEIVKAIRRLMVEKEGEDMMNRAAILKEKAEVSVMKGGSSYESLEQLTSYLLSFSTDNLSTIS